MRINNFKRTTDFKISLFIGVIGIAGLILSTFLPDKWSKVGGNISIIVTFLSIFWVLFDQKIQDILSKREYRDMSNDFSDKIFKTLIQNASKELTDKYQTLKENKSFILPSPKFAREFLIDILDNHSNYDIVKIKATLNLTILDRLENPEGIINNILDPNSNFQKSWNKCLSNNKIVAERLLILPEKFEIKDKVIKYLKSLNTQNKKIFKVYSYSSKMSEFERDFIIFEKKDNTGYLFKGGSSESSDIVYNGRIRGFNNTHASEIKIDYVDKFNAIYKMGLSTEDYIN